VLVSREKHGSPNSRLFFAEFSPSLGRSATRRIPCQIFAEFGDGPWKLETTDDEIWHVSKWISTRAEGHLELSSPRVGCFFLITLVTDTLKPQTNTAIGTLAVDGWVVKRWYLLIYWLFICNCDTKTADGKTVMAVDGWAVTFETKALDAVLRLWNKKFVHWPLMGGLLHLVQ